MVKEWIENKGTYIYNQGLINFLKANMYLSCFQSQALAEIDYRLVRLFTDNLNRPWE